VRVAIQGVGHVGEYLAKKLHAAGAKLILTDVNVEALRRVAAETNAEIVAPSAIFDADADVFAPCALGGAVSLDTLPRLRAKIIAGAANNQLAGPDAGLELFKRGILYAPDYVINGGGIINVAGEIRALERGEAFDPAWVDEKLDRLALTLEEVLDQAQRERRPTHEVAGEIAKARILGAPRKQAAA
jgi:leucine dehydrogenase